jgi:DNA-directed RNA polymerase specialized sigma24 family protein
MGTQVFRDSLLGTPMPTVFLYLVHLPACLRRLHAGNSAAEEELLHAAGNRLERLARRTLRTLPNVRRCADTSAVFQEAVLRLLGSLRQLKPQRDRA